MVPILHKINFNFNKRTTGLQSRSKIFGFSPRETIRKDYCSATALAYEDPKGHKTICDFAGRISSYYQQYCPDMFNFHNEQVHDKIKNEWIIEKSPFTSGIINKNNPLKYHLDRGNIRKVFSNMVCFKKDCTGGHLSVPEFNLGLEISDKSLVFFDGQSIMHGVTPFHINSVNGYRYTIVYYTLQQMWKCEPINEELARIKSRKTERETLRYKRLIGAELTEEEMIKSQIAPK